MIGIALSLPAGGYALLASLRAVAQGASLEPQLSVFLRAEAKRADADALGAKLKATLASAICASCRANRR